MDFEKLIESNSLPEAIDLSHHLSTLSRNRKPSPLKNLQKYFGQPGVISLAGGLPHPDYFPFESIGGKGLYPDNYLPNDAAQENSLSWLWNLFSANQGPPTFPVNVPKYTDDSKDVNLATALQYGIAAGLPQLQQIINEFTAKVYKPAYSNFATTLHTGNTDGWHKILMTLCNPGECVLTSEWTYPSALSTMVPYNILPEPVPMDGQGMSPVALHQLLSAWDVEARQRPRPHVIYIIPVGQNPTGATMGLKRKQEIYAVCVEFDVIIVEDDPYYFLQEGEYLHPRDRSQGHANTFDAEDYISSLVPSFLAVDYQGRVVRMDTFSKTIAPGCRLGWFTTNPLFGERLLRMAETSTQAPCGFGQSLVTNLLLKWKYEGYVKWLKGLGISYTERRNYLLDCIMDRFNLQVAVVREGVLAGCKVYEAYEKLEGMQGKTLVHPLFSFVPPTSGMFVWLTVHFNHHPGFNELNEQSLETKLFIDLAENGLLIGPGFMFDAAPEFEGHGEKIGHFRISFSNARFEDLKKAVAIIDKVMRKFFRDM